MGPTPGPSPVGRGTHSNREHLPLPTGEGPGVGPIQMLSPPEGAGEEKGVSWFIICSQVKASPHLFQLIQSLSQTEKRYFRLFSDKHVIGGKNNYMILFDALEKLAEFDEDKLRHLLRKEQALLRNLAYEKNYLYEILTDSLHLYHLNLSRESELKKQLHLVGILFEKGLYSQCHKQVKQVKQAGEELEKFHYVYEALLWQKRLMMQKSYSGITEKELEGVFKEIESAADKLRNQVAYSNLSERLRYLIDTSGHIRNKEQRKKFDKVVKDPLLKRESQALSNSGKRIYNSIWMNYHYYTQGPLKKIVQHTSRELELLESSPALIEENPNLYIGVLGNITVTLIEQKDYVLAKQYLDRLRILPQTLKLKENLKLKIFVLLYSQELTLYIESGAFEQVSQVIGAVEEGLNTYEGKIGKTHAVTIYYNLAYLYIGTGEYRKALQWLNKILMHKEMDAREDIICFSRILQLIVYYELNDLETIPYVLKSTYRYLLKRKRVYQGETILLGFIRQAAHIPNREGLTNAYLVLKKNLGKLESDSFEKTLFVYFDFISWLESKTEGRKFSDIVKAKQ